MNNQQAVNTIIANTLGVEELDIMPDAEFQLDLNATLSEMQKIKSAIEEELDITLPEFEEDSPQTVAELYELVNDASL